MIFVALAVAWSVFLIPRIVRHYDEQSPATPSRYRSTLRILARRDAVDAKRTALLRTNSAGDAADLPTRPETSPRVSVSGRAARRRRRVLGVLTLALAAVAGCAIAGLVHAAYIAIPAGLLLAWLVACRLAVRPRARTHQEGPVAVEQRHESGEYPAIVVDTPVPETPALADATDVAQAVEPAPDSWTPVSTPLPSYVEQAAITHRTVRALRLDETGVWSAGHLDSDSELARAAEQQHRAATRATPRAASN